MTKFVVKVFDDLLGIVVERTSIDPTPDIIEMSAILVREYESNPRNLRVKVERVE